MLAFLCPPTSSQPEPLHAVHGAHLLGADGVPLRGAVRFDGDRIVCELRSGEPAALSLLWDVPGYGVAQLETTRLPGRDDPYVLTLELARRRLMRINLKREEWGLFDYAGMEPIAADLDQARECFIRALSATSTEDAAEYGAQSLRFGLIGAEKMTRFHAGVFLGRRQGSRGFAQPFLGAVVPASKQPAELLKTLGGRLDFVQLGFNWRDIQPTEQAAEFDAIDKWVTACKNAKLPVHAGPLLSFGVQSLPDWMYLWENDYESVLNYARDYVRQAVSRYAKSVKTWVVASGLHATDALSLSFEHVIEMTRLAAVTAKQSSGRGQVLIELTQPWGEYFSRNQRTVPPLLYAEMVSQSGIPFDGFGVQFLFGVQEDGYHLRDLLQISALLDRVANLGKPIHITGVCVPSAPNQASTGLEACGGRWRSEWSETTQSEWLLAFLEVALSKPFVETVALHDVVDQETAAFGSCGVLRADRTPKAAYAQIAAWRDKLRLTTA